jgi:formate hydrogenlyase subunit 3/multisubunit Na+/H+ antiporter MnhD subunit
MIEGPTFIMGGVMLMAMLAYPLRRWGILSTLAAGAIGIALTTISLYWPLDQVKLIGDRAILLNQPLAGLGYTLAITEAERPILATLGVIALATFVGTWIQRTTPISVPIGLIILTLWVGSVIVQPLTGALLALLVVSCLSVFIIQGDGSASTRAAFRQMWWPAIAFSLGMLAAWHAQEAAYQAGNVTHLQSAARLMGLALWLLLAPVPLHAPSVSLLTRTSPVMGAFLITGMQIATLHLVWTVSSTWPWLAEHIEVSRILALSGLVTLLWGALGALSAERVQRLWAYAALHDWGVFLLGFSLGAPLEWRIAAALFVGRLISLFLSAYGLAGLRARGIQDDWSSVHGQARRSLWTALGMMVGGLGLAGFPLTASFAPRWALIRTLLLTEPVWGLLVVAGQLGVALGYLRLLQVFWAPLAPGQRLGPRETTVTTILLIIGIGFSGVLGLIPQAANGIIYTVIGIITQSLRQVP